MAEGEGELAGSSLGHCVARLRGERGLTQAAMAGLAGVSVETVKKLEQGVRKSARLSTLRALACVLGVPTAVLLSSMDVHPLRRIRHQRGMTLAVLAGQVGLSVGFLSLVETGGRELRTPAHIVALASALRVEPLELVPWMREVSGESSRASCGFPMGCDEATVARHGRLAGEFAGLLASGDESAAGALLHRAANDRAVDPWLLLDQFTRRAARKLVSL